MPNKEGEQQASCEVQTSIMLPYDVHAAVMQLMGYNFTVLYFQCLNWFKLGAMQEVVTSVLVSYCEVLGT